jgi:hypothetical protein
MPPTKRTKKRAKKAAPKAGLLDKPLVEGLKAQTPGQTDGAVVLNALQSKTPAQLKAATAKLSAAERNRVFDAIPNEQIAPLLGTLLPILQPAEPAAPIAPPAPTGGPPASILTTTYENAIYQPAVSDPDWASKISDGNTIGITSPPPWEWVSVYDQRFEKEGSLNNPVAGLTGWAVAGDPPISTADVWFVHPFGNDFQFFVAPDPQYEGLLGASNDGVHPGDAEFDEATTVARDGTANRAGLGLPASKGVIGVEIDQGLVPPTFQQQIADGTRVAVFGRWIVDCGHDDFHTEIHPPLLMATATPTAPPAGRPGASEMTHVEIMSRPFSTSQKFEEGNFIDHLLVEVAKVEDTFLGIPSSLRVEAHPTVLTPPYQGRPFIELLVQPPPRPHSSHPPLPIPETLTVNFHFTHRTGVAMEVFEAGPATVGIAIVLGDLNPSPIPDHHGYTVQWSQLGDDYSYVIDGLQILDLLSLNVASAVVLNRGILTDAYDAPVAASPLDNQNIATPVGIESLHPGVGFSEDDNQPFPVYGWLDVYWQRLEQPPILS